MEILITGTAESNNRAHPHSRKVIPYKDNAAHRAAEGKVSTMSKPTLEEEENWDEELPLPHRKTPPGAKPLVPSQEDKWKLMVNQDLHSGSVVGDSGHGMMAVTQEDEPINSNEELVGVVGGIDEGVTTENLSDVEWKDDPLFEFDDKNVTKPPAFRHGQKTKWFHQLNHLLEMSLASRSQSQYVF